MNNWEPTRDRRYRGVRLTWETGSEALPERMAEAVMVLLGVAEEDEREKLPEVESWEWQTVTPADRVDWMKFDRVRVWLPSAYRWALESALTGLGSPGQFGGSALLALSSSQDGRWICAEFGAPRMVNPSPQLRELWASFQRVEVGRRVNLFEYLSLD